MPTEEELAALHETIVRDWCGPLARAGVPLRAVPGEGGPAPVIMNLADREAADLVVTGRRGGGGFSELLLGGTTIT
jgi:nucleotide-binding universal stress UspA family protein